MMLKVAPSTDGSENTGENWEIKLHHSFQRIPISVKIDNADDEQYLARSYYNNVPNLRFFLDFSSETLAVLNTNHEGAVLIYVYKSS